MISKKIVYVRRTATLVIDNTYIYIIEKILRFDQNCLSDDQFIEFIKYLKF